MGYVTLNTVLPWLHQQVSKSEYEDYLQLLKKVCFNRVHNWPRVESSYSLGRGPTVLEETTPRNSRA
jgi:hypothetical protein